MNLRINNTSNKIKDLHPRNAHKHGYDFTALIKAYSPLAVFVKPNSHGNNSIDFTAALAVKALNTALLKQYYNIDFWDIPIGALCPAIPGRADYIHYVAELLGVSKATCNEDNTLANTNAKIKLLDIGTGANGIYPLLACQIYGWHCVGTDINTQSLENVALIIANNPTLKGSFTLRLQNDKHGIFSGIIHPGERFDISVCNPPFHASEEEAIKANRRKRCNLEVNRGEHKTNPSTLNFGGQAAELWCNGGEKLFLKKLIKESQLFSSQCRWFTSLISKQENIKPCKKLISKLGATDIREIEMHQGNKKTRILAWTFA